MGGLALRFGGRYRILDRGAVVLRGRYECHNWPLDLIMGSTLESRSVCLQTLWGACRNCTASCELQAAAVVSLLLVCGRVRPWWSVSGARGGIAVLLLGEYRQA
jgi:hypothetical protein